MAKKKTFSAKVRAMWRKIPEVYRLEIVSVTQTFIAVFGATFVMFVQTNGTQAWTYETVVALIIGAFVAAARAGVKAAWIGAAAWLASRAQVKK